MAGKLVSVIEERSFLRECIRRGVQLGFPIRVLAYSDIQEFQLDKGRGRPSLIILSCLDLAKERCANALDELLRIEPRTPVVVLGPSLEFLNVATSHGAKGYIPATMEFKVVVEAVRVVLAGGTYMPMDCLPNPVSREQAGNLSTPLTARELLVVRAIQLGKSNKAIASNLNITESTVKVHVRHIMTKLQAKNRTKIAIMSEKIFGIFGEQFQEKV
jgi:DNA-binding NarL/FixJ family response regulator